MKQAIWNSILLLLFAALLLTTEPTLAKGECAPDANPGCTTLIGE